MLQQNIFLNNMLHGGINIVGLHLESQKIAILELIMCRPKVLDRPRLQEV